MVKLANAETAAQKKATRAAYGATLAELAAEGVPVVAVDADLTGSTTTKKLADAGYAGRLFNCGIAEQNMIDVAAGLSLAGNIAFTGSFAVFGTGRAYDQIRNTVCYSNLNVKIAPTHAGISVGPDGGSHQMLEDVSLMRGLPGMRVLVPADYAAARGIDLDGLRVGISGSVGQMFGALFGSEHLGTLLLTGGDTLLQCMNSVGARELEPVCELESGIVLARFTYQGRTRYVITKSGGFGQEDLLVELADRIAKH